MYYIKKQNDKIIGYVESSTHPEGYEPVTIQEIQEHEQSLLSVFVTISIPTQYVVKPKLPKNPTTQQQAQYDAIYPVREQIDGLLDGVKKMFSHMERNPSADGSMIVFSNINLAHIPMLQPTLAPAYDNLKTIGVVFDEKIDALFVSDADENAT